jgi:hypothetical protein
MTPFLFAYKNNSMHDKCIFYSQQEENEKMQESMSGVDRKMEETLTMQVSKQQTVLSSAEVILKMLLHVPCHITN